MDHIPIIGIIAGVVALAIAISVGGTILATTTDRCEEIIYVEGVPEEHPGAGGIPHQYYHEQDAYPPHWILREDRIDDASYWRDIFTELPAYDADGGNHTSSKMWDNRHVFSELAETCQCRSVGIPSDPTNLQACGVYLLVTTYWYSFETYSGGLCLSSTPTSIPDYSFFGPQYKFQTEPHEGVGYGIPPADINNTRYFPGQHTYMTNLDLCRLYQTVTDIAHNSTRWCLTADGGTWDADTNPAVIPPLEPDDYWVILDPLSPQ